MTTPRFPAGLVLALSACSPEASTHAGTTMAAASDSTSESGSTSGFGDSTAGVGGPTPACVDFLQCIEARDPDLLAMADAVYGEGAACWSGTDEDAAICDASCAAALAQQCGSGEGGGDSGDAPACSLDAVAPGVPSPVVTGTGRGELPPDIGAIVEAHCGCHLVAEPGQLLRGTPPYLGPVVFRTFAEMHATHGVRTGWQWIELRTIDQQSMPPVYHCGTADFGSLPGGDYEQLAAWIAAGAPDGATWTP